MNARRRVLAGLSALAVAAVVGSGGPAQAISKPAPAPTGQSWKLVTALSVSDGLAKSVTATCPPGMQVTGAGGRVVSTTFGKVTIDDIAPGPALMSVTVTAAIRYDYWDPAVDAFQVEATARCARTAATDTAPAVVTGLTLIPAGSPENGTSDTNKTAVAACPAGKTLYGTGFELNGADGKVMVNEVVPDALLRSVTVTALNYNPSDPTKPFAGVWDLAGFAICGDSRGHDDLGQATSTSDGTLEKSVTAPACAAGTLLTGAGLDIDAGSIWTSIVAPVKVGLAPHSSSESPATPALFLNRASASGSGFLTDSWSVTAYSICH